VFKKQPSSLCFRVRSTVTFCGHEFLKLSSDAVEAGGALEPVARRHLHR
jgi:hypothetical protein